MPTPVTSDSAYRRAEAEYGTASDELWEYLEKNKHEDGTLAVGWALERARRYFHLDQQTVAQRTAIADGAGNVVEEPISKSFISALLSGRTKAAPPTYARIAHAAQVSPLEFYLAEHWLDPADISAYDMAEKDVALPIIQKLLSLPEWRRPRAKAVVLSVLESLAEAENVPPPEAEEATNGNGKAKPKRKS